MPYCTMFIGMPLEVGMVLIGALMVFVVRYVFNITLGPYLAFKLAIREPKKVAKFNENAFNQAFYLLSFSLGCVALWTSTWKDMPLFIDTNRCVGGISFKATEWGGILVKSYYGMASSYYLQGALTSLTIDTQRSDRWLMFAHHVVTLVLVIGSAYSGRFRAGFLILLLHDISDIFLYTAKVFHYARSHWDKSLFFLFAVSFIVTRLFFLPSIAYSVMQAYECEESVIFLDLGAGWIHEAPYVFGMGTDTFTAFGLTFRKLGVLIFFLMSLICMHIWWASIIVKMAIGGATQDERSDDEEDEEYKDKDL